MKLSKRGRKPKPYISSSGQVVVGLRRRSNDGRWVVVETGEMFSEADEAKAIERFEKMVGMETDADVYDRTVGRSQLAMTTDQMWAYVAKEIRARPKWVAEQTGIEQLAYLRDLKPLEPLPTLAEIERTWTDFARGGSQEKRLVLASWNDFISATSIGCISEITTAKVVAYRDKIYASGLGGKTQSHRFNRIRRVLRFMASRAIAIEAVEKTLVVLRLLTPSEATTSIDPKPISVDDFHKLLNAAQGEDRAMILMMLNAALYTQEVVRLRWDEIKDGCYISHRSKKGKVVRVAVLWQETLDALASVKHRGEFVFISETGLPLTISGAEKRFRKLRKVAEVSTSTTASHLRDGALTASVAGGVSKEIYSILGGHRSGISDQYVKRNTSMVKVAMDAIYTHYFKA